jgi:HAD superfamily hydrolase (TIGR01509 family)
MTTPIRALIYDCGHTLLRPRAGFTELCEMLAVQHGHSLDPVAFERALPHTSVMGARDVTMYTADHSARDGWAWYYAGALGELLELPAEEMEHVGSAIYDWYCDPAQWEPYPDVERVLAEGKRRGYVQGVLSDWGSDLLPILRALDLTKYLDFVVVSAVIGFAKPGNEIFREALQRAAVDPHEAIYVGDSYIADVLGARSAGLRAVLLDRDGHAPAVDCEVVATLDEVLALANTAAS